MKEKSHPRKQHKRTGTVIRLHFKRWWINIRHTSSCCHHYGDLDVSLLARRLVQQRPARRTQRAFVRLALVTLELAAALFAMRAQQRSGAQL